MYNLGDLYTSFEWFGTCLIISIMKNGAGNRAAGRNDQKHHAKSGPSGHEVSKVSLGPAIPDPSAPCGWATPETDL
jgi:hypothetical protein